MSASTKTRKWLSRERKIASLLGVGSAITALTTGPGSQEGTDNGEGSFREQRGCLFQLRQTHPAVQPEEGGGHLSGVFGGSKTQLVGQHHDQALSAGWGRRLSSGPVASSLGKWMWPRTTGILKTILPPLLADRENEAQDGRT